MIIDSHQHLWQIGRNDQSWPTADLNTIYRDYSPDDLAEAAPGVDGTVLVQSQPSETDTLWLLHVAKMTPLIKGVVGWTDMAAPKAVERIRYLSHQTKFKGLRPMLQGLGEDDWVLRPELDAAVEAMVELGLTFDALVFTRHLGAIDALAKRWPNLAIVVDHAAKPPFTHDDDMASWRDAISAVAQNPNVSCKLSGLVTEMPSGQDMAVVAMAADHLLAVFGAERLMWGSDWPVVLLRGSYSDWFGWTRRWLRDKEISVREHIMGRTAERVYRLS